MTRFKLIKILLVSTFAAFGLLAGCTEGEDENPSPQRTYPVTFDLSDIIGDVPVDSFDIEIKIGDGDFTRLNYNLVTGEAVTPVKAKPGDAFLLRFVLYSGGIRVGQGTLKGDMQAQSETELEPAYDSTAIAEVKQRLVEGLLLPVHLSERYGLALAGRPVYFTVDSTGNHDFVWTLTPEGESAQIDTTHRLTWIPSASLAGKSVAVKVEAFLKSTGNRIESRNWSLRVLALSGKGRLLRFTTRNDTAATHGTLTRLSHGDSITLRQTFSSLNPTRDEAPVQVDSVLLDNYKRPLLIRTTRLNGETLDSSFSWSTDSQLIALRVRQGSSIQVDSFTYSAGRLKETRHFLNDSLVERMVHHRDGESGTDTVFTVGEDGKWEINWVFRNRFQGEHTIEKTWLLMRNGLQSFRRETFLHTGLGSLLRYRRYKEGETSTLEYSETWTYDAHGQVLRRLGRDEVLGQNEIVQDFTWEALLAKAGHHATAYRTTSKFVSGAWRRQDAGLNLTTLKTLRTLRANGGLQ